MNKKKNDKCHLLVKSSHLSFLFLASVIVAMLLTFYGTKTQKLKIKKTYQHKQYQYNYKIHSILFCIFHHKRLKYFDKSHQSSDIFT